MKPVRDCLLAIGLVATPANRDHSIEVVFMGLFDFTSRATLAPHNPDIAGIFTLLGSEENRLSIGTGLPFGFNAPNFIDGLENNLVVDLLHESDFNSLEANYVLGGRPAKDRLVMQPDGRWVRHATPSKVRGLFAGFRYIRQNDLFQYRGVGDGTTGDLDVGGRYLVKTSNDLFGVQLGGEYVHKRTDWMLGFKGKTGGLVNFANRFNRLERTTASTDGDDRVITNHLSELDLNDETLTFLAEVGAYVSYYVRPNTAVRVGYDVVYLNGLATATNNLGIVGDGDGNDFERFELTGDSLYHGMHVGFELTW